MNIQQTLDEKLKTALKAGHRSLVAALRLIKSAVKNNEIERGHQLSESEFFAVLSTMAKQRRDSIEQFNRGGRDDLVKIETEELQIIESFLPQALTDAELESLIQDAITEAGATGPRDMGNVMKVLKNKTAGRVDGKVLAEKVKEKLSSQS